jgi:hypothetical protein
MGLLSACPVTFQSSAIEINTPHLWESFGISFEMLVNLPLFPIHAHRVSLNPKPSECPGNTHLSHPQKAPKGLRPLSVAQKCHNGRYPLDQSSILMGVFEPPAGASLSCKRAISPLPHCLSKIFKVRRALSRWPGRSDSDTGNSLPAWQRKSCRLRNRHINTRHEPGAKPPTGPGARQSHHGAAATAVVPSGLVG